MTDYPAPSKAEYIVTFIVSLILFVGIGYAMFTDEAEAHNAKPSVTHCKQHTRTYQTRNACIIRIMFAPVNQSRKAVRVAWCESSLRPWARGPHDEYGNPRQGLWQFGTWERSRFGYGRTAEAQTRAALRYYLIAGWGPWECA